MARSLALPPYSRKTPSRLTNRDVVRFVDDYKTWLLESPDHLTLSQFAKQKGLKNPYRFLDYLRTNFTGIDNTVDFNSLWSEVERVREDKLIELGIFEKEANSNFILGMLKSKFGWHDNTIVVGVSMNDLLEAKKLAVTNAKQTANR